MELKVLRKGEKKVRKMGSNSGDEATTPGSTGNDERILVSVRVRPLNDKELAKNDLSEWKCVNDTTIVYKSNLSASERSLYPTNYTFGMKRLILQICK